MVTQTDVEPDSDEVTAVFEPPPTAGRSDICITIEHLTIDARWRATVTVAGESLFCAPFEMTMEAAFLRASVWLQSFRGDGGVA